MNSCFLHLLPFCLISRIESGERGGARALVRSPQTKTGRWWESKRLQMENLDQRSE